MILESLLPCLDHGLIELLEHGCERLRRPTQIECARLPATDARLIRPRAIA
jgi:hypothetical protein